MKSIKSYLIICFCFFACGNQKEKNTSPDEIKQSVENVLGAKLPNSAKNIEFMGVRAFTYVAYIKFDIGQNDLNLFLLSSKILPDTINERNDYNFPIEGSSMVEWWKPQELKNPIWDEKHGKKTDEIHWSTYVAIGDLETNYKRVYICYVQETMKKKLSPINV